LRRQAAEIWVTSGYLQQKYADWHPKLVLPSLLSSTAERRRLFYHGSASHDAEIRWLRPVLEEALRGDERLLWKSLGDGMCTACTGGAAGNCGSSDEVAGVSVFSGYARPAYWPGLLCWICHSTGHAPIRSFFDITRCGAAGIYSRGAFTRKWSATGRTDWLWSWTRRHGSRLFLELARDEPLRQSLFRKAEVKSQKLVDLAQHGYSSLLGQHSEKKS